MSRIEHKFCLIDRVFWCFHICILQNYLWFWWFFYHWTDLEMLITRNLNSLAFSLGHTGTWRLLTLNKLRLLELKNRLLKNRPNNMVKEMHSKQHKFRGFPEISRSFIYTYSHRKEKNGNVERPWFKLRPRLNSGLLHFPSVTLEISTRVIYCTGTSMQKTIFLQLSA